jgi:hypothetical protein
MAWLIARYPYLSTASGGKPIVWMGLTVNEKLTLLPATPAPERMRTSLSPQAAQSVDYSETQRVELKFVSRSSGEFVGPRVTIVPQLDHELDVPGRVGADGPWYQYPSILLGQDFLENVSIALVGSRQVTIVFDVEAEDD